MDNSSKPIYHGNYSDSRCFEPGTLDLDYIENDVEEFEEIAAHYDPNNARHAIRMITAAGWVKLMVEECRLLRARIKTLEEKTQYEAALPRGQGSGRDGGL